jgi:hypothetical protein
MKHVPRKDAPQWQSESFSSYNSASSKYGSLTAETVQLFPRKPRGYRSPNNTVGYTGYKWKTLDNWNPRSWYGISCINELSSYQILLISAYFADFIRHTKKLWRNCIQVRLHILLSSFWRKKKWWIFLKLSAHIMTAKVTLNFAPFYFVFL